MKKEDGILILTPEHVLIRLTPAGFGSRFMAWLIDAMMQLAIYFLMSMFITGILGDYGTIIVMTLWLIVSWGFHVFFDMFSQGRSPGKRMMGLRVVDERGLPISFQQSMIRNLVRAIDMQPGVFYGVGGLITLLHPHSRRLGDVAAGTIVVMERQASAYPAQVAEGRQYNSLRTPAMTRMIRHKISLEEREFLLALCLRAPKMDDKRRFDLMDEVGTYYREKLKVDDPHLSGENFVRGLTAVIFESKHT
jgi:uncharacterized RDD family membrane protein YckC